MHKYSSFIVPSISETEIERRMEKIKKDFFNNRPISLTILWDTLFGENYDEVPIDLAIKRFKIFINQPEEIVSTFVHWLSTDNATVHRNSLMALYAKIKRDDYNVYPEDVGLWGTHPLGNKSLVNVSFIIYQLVNDPGYKNIDKSPKYLPPCEYIFRKSSTIEVFFVFEYFDTNGKDNKYAIYFFDDYHFGLYPNVTFDKFKDLRNNLILLDSNCGVLKPNIS